MCVCVFGLSLAPIASPFEGRGDDRSIERAPLKFIACRLLADDAGDDNDGYDDDEQVNDDSKW